jgi:Family of unknown function (DUF6502)
MNQPTDAIQTEQQALLGALSHLLQPFAELCLAKGVTIQAVEELVRRAFVQAARQACQGAKPDRLTSRISTMTGLTRREVGRLEAEAAPALPMTRSLSSEVLTHWISEPGYTDTQGHPLKLARQGEAPSFEALAATVTRDVHPRTLLEEMLRLGLVSLEAAGEHVRLLEEAFVPRNDWQQMVGFLGRNVGDHLRAAASNVLGSGSEHFEQAILADELSELSLQQARMLISEQWRELMTRLGPRLQALMDEDQATGRTRDQQVRIGLYSWSQPMAQMLPPASNTPQTESPNP